MGQKASLPSLNAKFQVIGCGLSRTGTTSFGEALEILLGGPVYHGGTQILLREEAHLKEWIEVARRTPIKNQSDRAAVLQGLKHLLSGYTATTDMPPILFTEELLEVFPDAKVICTVRDPAKWWKSIKPVFDNADRQIFFYFAFALLPTMRYFQTWSNVLRHGRFGELYYTRGRNHPTPEMYDDHMEYITRVVPKERLLFYDVRDGWEPLCKMLGCPVPDVPFPLVNDAAAVESFYKYQMLKAALSWLGLGAVLAVCVAYYWRWGV